MSAENARPGWYPVPDGRQRYWDGARWTEHFAPGPALSPAPVAAKPWYASTAFIVTAAVGACVLLLMMMGAVAATSSPDEAASLSSGISSEPATEPTPEVTPEPEESETPTPEATVEPAEADGTGDFGPQPSGQRKFVAAAIKGQQEAATATNELKQGAALRTRSKSLCAALDNTMKVANWTGVVTELGANGEGKGVLAIDIADDVEVKTWNNAFSDIGDGTLIEPSSKLFDQILGLEEGQVVKFSGSFLREGDACLKESSLTLGGNLDNPEFIFKFSKVSAVN